MSAPKNNVRRGGPDHSLPRVIVLGAGMSGLAAARHLQAKGAEVTVIEARDRIGGRTHTSHLWPDLPVDMGASWVHGETGNPLTVFADKIGAARTTTSYLRSIGLDDQGRTFDFISMAEKADALVHAARVSAEELNTDLSLQDAIEAFPAWQSLAPHDRRAIRLAINTRIEHEYSGDWSRLSAWNFDDGDDFAGNQVVFNRGYGALVAHIARGLEVRLGEPVLKLTPLKAGVEITTTLGRHVADHAIVTLPLGVLKAGTVCFDGALDSSRKRAIDGLQMGLLNKCWLRFDHVFWPKDVDWIDYLGPEQGLWADWLNGVPSTGYPLLVGFNAASAADNMEHLDDRATTASAMVALRAMFGSAVPDPVGSQITRWRQDPFSGGSYSFNAVGTHAGTRRDLFGADWNGRLHFAGEATSHNHPGTAHGALMTGIASAKAVLKQHSAALIGVKSKT